MYSSS